MRHLFTPWERLALIAIVAVGASLRFQHMGDIEVNVDQVYPIWQAIQTLDAGEFPLAGQGTSVLFANPPLTGYLFAPLIALVRHPVAAYAATLILNTVAIWLAYRALRWLIGTRPALIGATLFAANPWIIEDSRRTWVQSFAPFFVCLIFWALVPVLTGQTRHPARRTLIALIGLALFAHTYLLAYTLIAPVGLLIVLFWRRIPKRPLILGAAIFAVLMALYGIGLARQWDDTSARADQFASGPAKLSGEALGHALRLVTGGGYADERGEQAPARDTARRDALSDAIHALWVLAIALGIVRALTNLYLNQSAYSSENRAGLLTRPYIPRSLKNLRVLCVSAVHSFSSRISMLSVPSVVSIIFLVWFLLPVLMMSYVSRLVHPFYLLLTIPAGHGLAAWGADWLIEQRLTFRRPGWILLAGLIAVTAGINGLNTIRFAQNTAAYPGEDLPETLPLEEASALRERLIDAGAPDLAVFSRMPEWTPIALVGRNFRTEDTYTYGRAALVPPQGGLYVLFEKPGDPPPIVPPYASPAGSPLVLDDNTRITIWRVMPTDLRIEHPAGIPSDIDVSFIGWTLDGDLTPGAAVTLDTFWRIEALHPERGIWSFLPVVHVIDANGATVAEDQGHAVSGLTWAAGDTMVQRLNLSLPLDSAGPFSLDLGLFDPVRVREDGTVGIQAIFRVPSGDETTFTPTLILGQAEAE